MDWPFALVLDKAGRSKLARIAITAMTTKSSIKENPFWQTRRLDCEFIDMDFRFDVFTVCGRRQMQRLVSPLRGKNLHLASAIESMSEVGCARVKERLRANCIRERHQHRPIHQVCGPLDHVALTRLPE